MVSRWVLLGVLSSRSCCERGLPRLDLSGGSKNSVTVVIPVNHGTTQNGAADAFSPRNFTVVERDQVTLVFENNDDNAHELVIPRLGVEPE
jgi:hypothetical protein